MEIIMALTIYHNPRCSKSRQTLALIEEAGAKHDVRRYLDDPLSETEIRDILARLGFSSARDLMRTGEAIYKEMVLKDVTDEYALIRAMASFPKLIERPIVDNGQKAVLGRPPENVQSLL